MISDRKWSLLICLVIGLQLVKTQYPMFPMPAPIYPGAMPVGGMAFPIPSNRSPKCKGKCRRTTTTTQKPCSYETSEEVQPLPPIPFPMPLPMAMPYYMPALPPPTLPPSSYESSEESKRKVRRPKCPPCRCKPSCTPATYSHCSPCHKKCKCRTKNKYYSDLRSENGILPNPVRMPPSQKVEVPSSTNEQMDSNIERKFRRAYSDESSNYYSISSESSYPIMRKRTRNTRHNRHHKRYNRRHNDVSEENEIGDSEFVRPVLSYISKNGDIKLEKRINSEEAAQLLGDKAFQTVNVMAEEDSDKHSRLLVRSNDEQKVVPSDQPKQVVLRRGGSRHVLGEGKKELVFTPPQDKKISNLTVSFQII